MSSQSEASSPVSDSSTTDSISPDGSTPGSASGTGSGQESLPGVGPECPSTGTLRLLPTPRSMDGQRPRMQESREGWGKTLGQTLSTLSPEASPVKESVQPVVVRDSATLKPLFGGTCSESFAHYDPDTSSWKTSQLSLAFTEEPCSTRSSPDWPVAGMTR